MIVFVGVLFRGRLPYTIFNSSYMSEDPTAPWEFDMAKPPGKTYKCDPHILILSGTWCYIRYRASIPQHTGSLLLHLGCTYVLSVSERMALADTIQAPTCCGLSVQGFLSPNLR